jgi:hypothetical protein
LHVAQPVCEHNTYLASSALICDKLLFYNNKFENGVSEIPPDSMAGDFSRSAPPEIGCCDFRRIFRQTCWVPHTLSCYRPKVAPMAVKIRA